jgi:hypothetical protein
MVYIVNKTKVNVDILRGKYLLAPLGWKEAPDEIAEDPNVLYALDRDWIKISKTKPKSNPDGILPAIIEYFDPSSPMTAQELNKMLGKQNERLAKVPMADEVPEDPLEDRTVAIHAKPVAYSEISPEEVKAASTKARGKKTTDTTPPPPEGPDLGSFS